MQQKCRERENGEWEPTYPEFAFMVLFGAVLGFPQKLKKHRNKIVAVTVTAAVVIGIGAVRLLTME